ncbi:MAG: flavodoxin family protein [Candidatus Altiarchaeota archaeon]
MRVAIVYATRHKGNTEKIAKAMAQTIQADLFKATSIDPGKLASYDLIGFGSGIYYGKHHKALIELANEMPHSKGTKAFIFSTSGGGDTKKHSTLKSALNARGYETVKEFSCKGHTTYCLLKLIGGLNKGRPGKEDVDNARKFILGLI